MKRERVEKKERDKKYSDITREEDSHCKPIQGVVVGMSRTSKKGGALAQSGVVGRRVCVENVLSRGFILFRRIYGRFNRDIVSLHFTVHEDRPLSVIVEFLVVKIVIEEELITPVDELQLLVPWRSSHRISAG